MTRQYFSVASLLRGAFFGFVLCSGLIACDRGDSVRWWSKIPGYGDYWWQRGQPKSPDELFSMASETLKKNVERYKSARPEIASAQEQIRSSISAAAFGDNAAQQASNLAAAEQQWMALEGKLSVGSRAAYGELAGELRAFSERAKAGQNVSDEGFRESLKLFATRVTNFLANEISVPAPVEL